MHDPSTLVFEIKRPWPTRHRIGRGRYFPPLVMVWHEDPEADGSDDSCGWSFARVPKSIRDSLRFEAGCEARNPWLLRDCAKAPLSIADAELKLQGAILTTARACKAKCSHKRASELASDLLHSPIDNIRSSLCFLPGYHSNSDEDRESDREQAAHHLYLIFARILLTRARPWWKHPRWHFWHWRFNVVPLQSFKRWAFSRCCVCGGRFAYGSAVCTNQWHGTGPQWFKSEAKVFHSKCDTSAKPAPVKS